MTSIKTNLKKPLLYYHMITQRVHVRIGLKVQDSIEEGTRGTWIFITSYD